MDGQQALDHITRLEKSLTNQSPSPEQIARIEDIREYAKGMVTVIVRRAPSSRETSLALTHLEETVMWAVKSIVLESDA